MSDFKQLIVWQKSIQLSVLVYRITDRFPKSEVFGLVSQMRRAAVSIASNIAEGQGRNSLGEYIQFLGHARGSLQELQTQHEIASRLGYGRQPETAEFTSTCEEISRMIAGLVATLRRRQSGAAISAESDAKYGISTEPDT